jgi:YD repeat-containing protein
LVISVTLTAFLAMVVVAGSVGYRLLKGAIRRVQRNSITNGIPVHKELPIQHGKVVVPEDLRGHGKLYFVPVGRQVIPIQALADYYLEKFGAHVTVLPQVEVQASDCFPERGQCGAEDLEAEMTAAYGEIARNPDSVMIALTDEDIFPRERGWNFTYSWHSARIGIVSSRRMDPAFWGEAPNEATRLANTRQMLTKYIALLYYHVPPSFDPTSVMRSPLTPNGGSDDIYQSDLHPEESVNGRRGTPSPCLFLSYSYETHRVTLDQPVLTDCDYPNPAHADEETFDTNLGWGRLTQRSLDLALDSTARIEFRRGYNSAYQRPVDFGLGWGVNHSYNAWLSSDGLSALTFINITREDGVEERFNRLDRGRGFDPNAIYETQEDPIYGARLTYQAGHYKLQYRDGAFATFLECNSTSVRCYWIGYQNAKGNVLSSVRAANQELQQVTSNDHQRLAFKYDDRHRIVTLEASDGRRVLYEYDIAGCLAQVQRADGQVALYEYDPGHHMTSFSVARQRGAPPENVLSNQYDAQGRLVRQTIAGVGVFKIEYLAIDTNRYARALRLTDPAGRVLNIDVGDEYVVYADTVRFPRAAR